MATAADDISTDCPKVGSLNALNNGIAWKALAKTSRGYSLPNTRANLSLRWCCLVVLVSKQLLPDGVRRVVVRLSLRNETASPLSTSSFDPLLHNGMKSYFLGSKD